VVSLEEFIYFLRLLRRFAASDACRFADGAVALAEGVVEAGQLFAARDGLDPEAELADLNLDKFACLKMGL
jgi:hypothetical protein